MEKIKSKGRYQKLQRKLIRVDNLIEEETKKQIREEDT